jgi:hypothetical protein
MPEQAMSMAKGKVVPFGRVMTIDGLPYSFVIEDGMPKALTMAHEASEVKTDRFAPIPYRISVGGGTKNTRKAMANAICLRVCGLKKMSVKLATSIGSASM